MLVHRPRHNDWSFPKGKLDEGESIEQGAVREVEEETGLRCMITRKFGESRYQYRTTNGNLMPKVVHYFFMKASGGELRKDRDREIDAVKWVPADEAPALLSYEADRRILERALEEWLRES